MLSDPYSFDMFSSLVGDGAVNYQPTPSIYTPDPAGTYTAPTFDAYSVGLAPSYTATYQPAPLVDTSLSSPEPSTFNWGGLTGIFNSLGKVAVAVAPALAGTKAGADFAAVSPVIGSTIGSLSAMAPGGGSLPTPGTRTAVGASWLPAAIIGAVVLIVGALAFRNGNKGK